MARTHLVIKPKNSHEIESRIYGLSESSLSEYVKIVDKWIKELSKLFPFQSIPKPAPVTWLETSLISIPERKWEILLLWDSYTNVNTITVKIASNKHLHIIVINRNKMYYCYDGKVQFVVKPIKSTLTTCLLNILYKVKEMIEIVNVGIDLAGLNIMLLIFNGLKRELNQKEKVIVGSYKVYIYY